MMEDRDLCRMTVEAMEAFRRASSPQDLWACLNASLTPFGIAGSLYGTETVLRSGPGHDQLVNSIRPDWFAAKMASGMFDSDPYVEAARTLEGPLLWSDTSAAEDLLPEQWDALAIDYDYNVLTGVTLPIPFAGGLGRSAMGCHADGLTWAEFERVWADGHEAVTRIVHAFDRLYRADHLPQALALSIEERDVLHRLAAGQRPKAIAPAMRLSDGRCRAVIQAACRKLGAANATQAVAIAVVHGIVVP